MWVVEQRPPAAQACLERHAPLPARACCPPRRLPTAFISAPTCLPARRRRRRWSWLADPRDARGRRPSDPDHDPTTLLVPPAAWRDDLKGADAQVGSKPICPWIGCVGESWYEAGSWAEAELGQGGGVSLVGTACTTACDHRWASPSPLPHRSTGASSRAAPTWCSSSRRVRWGRRGPSETTARGLGWLSGRAAVLSDALQRSALALLRILLCASMRAFQAISFISRTQTPTLACGWVEDEREGAGRRPGRRPPTSVGAAGADRSAAVASCWQPTARQSASPLACLPP